MIIFGGFVDGERVNETFKFSFKTGEWKRFACYDTEHSPQPRAGHSATLHVDGSGEPFMYVFGGKNL